MSLGMVGESGSGKTLTSLAIMGLLSKNLQTSGEIFWKGQNLLKAPIAKLNQIRGKDLCMIFQNPLGCLHPCYKVFDQMWECLKAHGVTTQDEAWKKCIHLLHEVGIGDPEVKLDSYVHELSGGIAQRVMIATTLLNQPELLLADEPTTALDVTVQAQVLKLLKRIQSEHKMSMLFVSHDLAVVSAMTDYLVVLYAGEIVEFGQTAEILQSPQHPYTQALLQCRPAKGANEFKFIPGIVPKPEDRRNQCLYVDRCPRAQAICRKKPAMTLRGDQEFRCYFPLNAPANENQQ